MTKQIQEGEWVIPRMSNYRMECCDCGLVHKLDFAVIDPETGNLQNGTRVAFRAYRAIKKKGKKK